jgi:hypothetical protein
LPQRSRFVLAALFALTSSAFANHTITSVSPTSARAGGGETVIIKGTDFASARNVLFGGTQAFNIQVVDSTTIEVKTPPHLPGVSQVTVVGQQGHSVSAPFTFTGRASEAFEQFLLPIYVGPVKGAFGSEFHTEFEAWNSSPLPMKIHGLRYDCMILCPILDPLDAPIELQPDETFDSRAAMVDGTPGRFIYVPKQPAYDLGTNLRVFDVSREAANYGTELRVVRAREFTADRPLSFPRVPTDSRFRITLRIYSPEENFAWVRFNDEEHLVHLTRSVRDLFTPAYGVFTAFPATGALINITVAPPDAIIHPPPLNILPPPIWAFLTITNNDTQQITTMNPN